MKKQYDTSSIENLLEIMATLRDPGRGCPWDREQTFASIAPYTIEEAYEVADAIERGALRELRGELGDLLFQVVFHSQLAEETGIFDFTDVARDICDKMRRRHPHVFGTEAVASSGEQTQRWEELKRAERAAKGGSSLLDDVPIGLPALTRAVKLGKRASAVGFDWSDATGVRAKIDEELAEIDAAAAQGDATQTAAEIGDLLLTVASWCRHLGVDPESCARAANARFERRFRHVEANVAASGLDFADHDAAALDALWNAAKASEHG